MIRVLNFSHPLTEKQIEQIKQEVAGDIEIIEIEVQVDRSRPLEEVAVELVEATGLNAVQWREQLLINPPGLVGVALALFIELQARCGYSPNFLNIRPTSGLVRGFEIGEIYSSVRAEENGMNRMLADAATFQKAQKSDLTTFKNKV